MQILFMLLTKLSSFCALGAVSVLFPDMCLHCDHGSAATAFICPRLVQGMDVSHVSQTLDDEEAGTAETPLDDAEDS